MVFIDHEGRRIRVFEGLGGGTWMSGRKTKSGGNRRIKSPYLPVRDNFDQAADDLKAYAQWRGWELLEKERYPDCKEYAACLSRYAYGDRQFTCQGCERYEQDCYGMFAEDDMTGIYSLLVALFVPRR